MINRAREIAEMMGYEDLDAVLEAIGRGELILLKVPESSRGRTAKWLRERIPGVEEESQELAGNLRDIANGLDMAMELVRYPADSDVCDMDLPHGWPSYCDKTIDA